MPRFNSVLRALPALIIGLCATPAVAQDSEACFDVDVLESQIEVCADIYENDFPFVSPLADTVLAIHGFTETAKTWVPMKDAMFSHPFLRFGTERVIALNLPGRDTSDLGPVSAAPLPPPVAPDFPLDVFFAPVFGNITAEDYADIIIQVIDDLRDMEMGPDVIMGHSMGGLHIQTVQEQLLDSGSSLAQRGIFRAILIGAVPSGSIADYAPATFPEANSAYDPFIGLFIPAPPAEVAQVFGFGRVSSLVGDPPNQLPSVIESFGALPPGAVPANFVGNEPLRSSLQLPSLADPALFPPGYILPRPAARNGAFNPIRGTLLTVIGLEEDILAPIEFQLPMYQQLVGFPISLGYRTVDTEDAVHSMHISNPEGLLDDLSAIWLLF